jgi:hypothetical protein
MGLSWGGPAACGLSYVSFDCLRTKIAKAGVATSATKGHAPSSLESADLETLFSLLDRDDPIRWFVGQGEYGVLDVEQCVVLARRLEKVLENLVMGNIADDCLDWVDWLHVEVVGAVRNNQRITWG